MGKYGAKNPIEMIVRKFKANGNKINVDLSLFAGGTYFVRIEKNGKIITKKILKL